MYTSRLDAPVVSSETDIIILYYNGIERTVVTKNKYALSARLYNILILTFYKENMEMTEIKL